MPHVLRIAVLLTLASPALAAGVPDTPFVQEYHEPYVLLGGDGGANDVRAVAVDGEGHVWAATKAGVFVMPGGDGEWRAAMTPEDAGPSFDVHMHSDGRVWAGAWNGLYRNEGNALVREPDIDEPITAITTVGEGLAAAGPDGLWRGPGAWKREPLRTSKGVRAVLGDGAGGLWVATGMGLYHRTDLGDTLYQDEAAIVSSDVFDVAYAMDGSLWAGGFGGVTIYRDGERAGQRTPAEGLPDIHARALARDFEGRMWVGTAQGVARFWESGGCSLRHSRRWLLSDDVRDIAFGEDGAAWIATAKGVSAIRKKSMTLAEKADYFMDVCMKRHVREPWIVEKVRLPKPGDTSQWRGVDDDNDGGYTANYLVMESCRYAVTKDPQAKGNAERAFDLLHFLQTVTETSGFLARTVVPVSWAENAPENASRLHDGNRTYTERELAESRAREPRYKPVEVRWRPSKDGKWLWKGDTSSDEVTSHFFGYLFYYDLVAEGAEKERAAALAARVMDYIMEHGYVFMDTDGMHTRWGVWAPERLNEDPEWLVERGINSVEILSYLKATYHMTGNEKYQQAYLDLLHKHGYAENLRHAKTFAPAWRTHIDDELLTQAYPAPLLYEDDPELKALWRESIDYWYAGIRTEQNSFFNLMYGLFTGADPQLEDSLFFLRDAPLDLVNWRVDNSKREDLRIVRKPILEVLQVDRPLPPSERGVVRWDKNPWAAVQGDGGHTAWAPTYWLMAYWLGRYAGFIE